MPWNLERRLAVVTGASSAIGATIVSELLRQSMFVVCPSRRPPHPSLLSKGSSSEAATTPDHSLLHIPTDLLSEASASACISQVKQLNRGPVSVLIHAAGVTSNRLFVKASDDELRLQLEMNLIASLRLTRMVLRQAGMLSQKDGSVLFIGSTVGVVGNAGQVAYAASKGALTASCASLASEYGGSNIRFNVLAPGLVEGSGMGAELSAEQQEQWRQRCALGRLVQPSHIAELARSIVQCEMLNGQTICLDGGRR